MKRLSFTFILLICGAGLLLSGCATTAQRPISSGVMPLALIRQMEGKIEVAQQDGTWTTPEIGDPLAKGDQVRTGPDSTVDIFFGANGGVLRVMPDSLMVFEEFGWVEENGERLMKILVNLPQGRVVGDALVPNERTRFFIKTATGMVQVQ